ncbi:TetR/AcrR family transcriptional regulator [Streptomyces acidiscabies]|uniref:Helix-turn-helix domain containing protein n=1 Tax=Streptomyces acidiscabies TaxID=42234 RepID=A0AAP6EKY0_9ACTN|nr:TetR/AcrR family transcriptional regulator [Streptomyces acidiscabies]MBP5942804.1 TetR/AcrR family transcriptional regulator [Streptomyces sp. LBUM 1476]MBZ3918087.1 TetR/AcrR family transcriptional regulator [Streptomyces acidiscabies]MDX2966529.1 helix-turn-helix domain containing protein [Streptomyces acidiscabies]MDX3021945.1 helix-turn-helix domain containing protein [Streptomyces acidiscabies]MDX3789602.1 helix-turn-helix domain containing protein [Streptomyces acidiscabies]
MKSNVKPTSEEIDHALTDVAAFVFAQHGFAQGTVQAIADAAGYSKAAVLKRFGSKERIQDAVVTQAEQTAATLADIAAAAPVGPGRDAVLVEALVRMLGERPGMGALVVGAFWLTREPEVLERLSGAQRTLMEAFDPGVWEDEERRVRVVAAIGAVTATMMARRDENHPDRTDVIVAAGLGALGHRPGR